MYTYIYSIRIAPYTHLCDAGKLSARHPVRGWRVQTTNRSSSHAREGLVLDARDTHTPAVPASSLRPTKQDNKQTDNKQITQTHTNIVFPKANWHAKNPQGEESRARRSVSSSHLGDKSQNMCVYMYIHTYSEAIISLSLTLSLSLVGIISNPPPVRRDPAGVDTPWNRAHGQGDES